MDHAFRTYFDALRVLARTRDPNRVVLIERNIDRYLQMDSGRKERGTARRRGLEHREGLRSIIAAQDDLASRWTGKSADGCLRGGRGVNRHWNGTPDRRPNGTL
jgi:hypothetical protein